MWTILEKMMQRSVLFNGVFSPAKDFEKRVSRYAEPLMIANENIDYPVSPMGSCVGIKYRERYLLLCTRHQLKVLSGRPEERVSIFDKARHKLCTSGGIRFFPKLNDAEIHDLAIFDFTEPCKDLPEMKEQFVSVHYPRPVMSDKIIGFIVSGYPSADQKHDFEQIEKHMALVQRTFVCELAPLEAQFSDQTTLHIKPLKPLKFDPDGLSGSPAFITILEDGQAKAYLSGIVNRANKESIHILRIGAILDVADNWLNSL